MQADAAMSCKFDSYSVSCPSPSATDGVVLNNVPSVTTEGSTLTITCVGTSDMVTPTYGSDGMWSPDLCLYC